MDNNYRELFVALANFSEIMSERVMEVQKKEGQLLEYKKSSDMRETYRTLKDNLSDNSYELTEKDAAYLILGAQVYSSHFEAIIEKQKVVIEGYKNDVIPKLVEYTKTMDSNIFSI